MPPGSALNDSWERRIHFMTPVKRQQFRSVVLSWVIIKESFVGPGKPGLTAREKALLLHIQARLINIWLDKDYRYAPKIDKEFEAVTGFDYSCITRFKKEVRENDGCLQDPKKRGPPVDHIENNVAFPALWDYIKELIEQAKKGGYLTVGILRAKLHEKYNIWTSRNKVKRSLKRGGFVYDDRRAEYLSRRQEEDVQNWARQWCKYVYENTAKAPQGELFLCFSSSFVNKKHGICWSDVGGWRALRVQRRDVLSGRKLCVCFSLPR